MNDKTKPIPSVRPADVPDGQPSAMIPYMCYLNISGREAAENFTARYGTPPREIFFYQRLIWVGPAPE
jgi:hypothetical protein